MTMTKGNMLKEKKVFDPIEFLGSSVEKIESEYLKAELIRRGSKSGGSLTDRAQRLYSVKGISFDEINSRLKQNT